jgi:hypothetical protein
LSHFIIVANVRIANALRRDDVTNRHFVLVPADVHNGKQRRRLDQRHRVRDTVRTTFIQDGVRGDALGRAIAADELAANRRRAANIVFVCELKNDFSIFFFFFFFFNVVQYCRYCDFSNKR